MQKERQKLNATIVIEMSSNQFPFGEHSQKITCYGQTRKIVVKKKVYYRNEKEKAQLDNKLSVLKGICHRNVINIRSVQEIEHEGYNIYYNYVPLSLETAFQDLDHQTFRELHKQIIQLAIYLAKNYILTSFNPNRCGVVFVEGKFIFKYYLPFNQIVITQNISMLERSVQLFKVQAMHMLDTLCHHDLLTELNSSSSDEIPFRNSLSKSKQKKSVLVMSNRNRKLSIQSFKKRKFSNYNSSKLSQIERKKSQDLTNFTQIKLSNLKKTLKNFRQHSERKRNLQKSQQKIKQRVEMLLIRSQKAIKIFESFKKQIAEYYGLSRLLKLCREI